MNALTFPKCYEWEVGKLSQDHEGEVKNERDEHELKNGLVIYGEKNADSQESLMLPSRYCQKRWITMSNALTRAAHGLTLSEKRLVLLALSKLTRAKYTHITDDVITMLTAKEYAETYGVTKNTAYNELKYAAKNLYQRSITFFEPAYNRKNSKSLEMTRVQMRWVGMVKYHDGEGCLEVLWIPKLLQNVVGLTKHFTRYQLNQATGLKSIYSWKLLELLMHYKNTGWAEYTIEDFCESMEATEKQRKNFANIRRRIIEPAVKELQEKDGWKIEWRPFLAGKKVVALCFHFSRAEAEGNIQEIDTDAVDMEAG